MGNKSITSYIFWSLALLVGIIAYYSIKINREKVIQEIPNTVSSKTTQVPFYPNSSGKD